MLQIEDAGLSLEPAMAIRFNIPYSGEAGYELNIRNATGYMVRQFIGTGSGTITILWNLKSQDGQMVNSGFYIVEVVVHHSQNDLIARRTEFIRHP